MTISAKSAKVGLTERCRHAILFDKSPSRFSGFCSMIIRTADWFFT